MDGKTQKGYLLLADISGYTSYVAGTELEHSHRILSELLELIVGHLTSVLTLNKLEGDCVFVYLPEDRLARGETLLELVETTYVDFRDRVESIRRNTTCDCRACSSIPMLDLKFILHFGDYIVQAVSGIQELVGSDVNLAHRLLKNGVSEATGWRAYILFTEEGLAKTGVQPEGLHVQVEAYEHLGEVRTYSLDLQVRYKVLTDARRVQVSPEKAHASYTTDIPAPPPVVWDWLNDPHRRAQWVPGTTWTAVARPGGRTGVGARSHCAHGKGGIIIETILDWRPFDYFTAEQWLSADGRQAMTITHRLEATAGGTRLHSHAELRTPLPGPLNNLVARLLGRLGGPRRTMKLMARLIVEEQARASVNDQVPAAAKPAV